MYMNGQISTEQYLALTLVRQQQEQQKQQQAALKNDTPLPKVPEVPAKTLEAVAAKAVAPAQPSQQAQLNVQQIVSDALAKVVADPALKSRFDAIGFDPIPMKSPESNKLVQQTGDEWRPVIKRLNIQM